MVDLYMLSEFSHYTSSLVYTIILDVEVKTFMLYASKNVQPNHKILAGPCIVCTYSIKEAFILYRCILSNHIESCTEEDKNWQSTYKVFPNIHWRFSQVLQYMCDSHIIFILVRGYDTGKMQFKGSDFPFSYSLPMFEPTHYNFIIATQ